MDAFTVDTPDGWRLGVTMREAMGERLGAVLLLHAMMVDARTLDRPPGDGLASHLARSGWDVFRADLRGRGDSGPKVSEGGSWTYDDLVFHDVPALVAAVRARAEGPLVLIGHSLGGHVSAASAAIGLHAHGPDAHVIIGGNVWMPSLEGSRRRRLKKGVVMHAFRQIAESAGHFPARRLRMGPVDESGEYVKDICRFWFEDAWRSRDGHHDYLAALPEVPGKVLCVAGAGDGLYAHVEGARAFAERFGPGRAEFWYLQKRQQGLGWDPSHMGMVTEARSRPFWRHLSRWMEDVPAVS